MLYNVFLLFLRIPEKLGQAPARKFPDVFENRSSALSALFCLLTLYIPIRNDIFPVLIENLIECGIFLIIPRAAHSGKGTLIIFCFVSSDVSILTSE